MREKLNSINNIPFLVCLAILLLNDFYLKTEYHNWLTGKLSDFCGLFIFASFWTALFPSKKRIVYFSTALFFVIWKSPYSQPFIDLFSHSLYPIYRVVDITDLISLLILPISYYFNQKNFFRFKLSPILLGVITIFSFCATSIPEPTQKFEQPQYLLFKDGVKNIENSEYPSNYKVHKLDSLLVVSITELRIDKRASIDDEYHKTEVLKNLDLRFLRQLSDSYRLKGELSDYKELLDSLAINESTSIVLKLDSFNDHLNFKETRLNGKFQRFKDSKLIIDGKYKDGIEDSIWTFYNYQNEIISTKYFVNGELVKNQLFENSKIKSEIDFNTRNETIRNKYFLLAIIFILIIGLILKLYLNFKKSDNQDIIKYSHFSKITTSLVLPVAILTIAKLLSSLIPNSYSTFFLGIFGEAILVYIVIFPMLLIVFYVIKLRTKFDLIYYILLFALSIILIEEWIYLKGIII
jgi:antitoxin component YwqK of YwqJK toxin-antitoxin module